MDFMTLGASVSSAVVSKLLMFPIDTIAVRRQTNTQRAIFPPDQSILHSARGLYRGLSAAIVLTTPAMCVYFCTYREMKERLTPVLGETAYTYVASGIAAEIASSVLWTPLEVLKNRLQVSSAGSSGALMTQIRNVYQTEGGRGFFRGYGLGLFAFLPYNAMWWTIYEKSKPISRSYGFESSTSQAAMGSMIGTAFSTSLLIPLDIIKTRYQVSTSESITGLGSNPVPGNKSNLNPEASLRVTDRLGVTHVMRNILRESGWRGLYAGLGPRLLHSIPASMISMAVFEYLKPDQNTMVAIDATSDL